jgi:hypothetical protein
VILVIAFMLILVILFSACVGHPAGPSSFEAEEGSGVMVPSPDVPNPISPPSSAQPAGQLQVSAVVVEHEKVRAFVTNTTPLDEKIHLCTYDCGETWDCRTALQTLHRDKRKILEPNTGAHLQAEVPCAWQWDILREDDPRESIPMTCPETYRWGEDYPGLERLASDYGYRICDPS